MALLTYFSLLIPLVGAEFLFSQQVPIILLFIQSDFILELTEVYRFCLLQVQRIMIVNCCKPRLLLPSKMKNFLLCFPIVIPLGLRLSKKKRKKKTNWK